MIDLTTRLRIRANQASCSPSSMWLMNKAATEIECLQARLAAHVENEGDECPLCVAEARVEFLEGVIKILRDAEAIVALKAQT